MNVVWSEGRWFLPALAALAVLAGAVILGCRAGRAAPRWVRFTAAGLKMLGFATLIFILLGPETLRSFARPGANTFAVLADTSASMRISDQAGGGSRAGRLRELLGAPWAAALEGQFEVQRFTFDSRLRPGGNFDALTFDGAHSSLGAALRQVAERTRGQPLAGIVVLTDGCATDLPAESLAGLPPVYPIVIAGRRLTDLAVASATATATVFEDAPVIVDAAVRATGARGRTVTARLVDLDGSVAAEESRRTSADDETLAFRFNTRPAKSGPVFYRVEATLDQPGTEATLENNQAVAAANRETGPFRVLCVAGHPSWEHKFLQRALAGDPSIKMASLVRIAKREPKFDWRGRRGETTNPLYRGFGADAEAEQYDESVFVRLGTRDAAELRAGFPRTAEELFGYEALILDDVEADFFTLDQQRLVQRFVSERGGSLVMLGGADSLGEGGYAGTPIGEVLPVYLDRSARPAPGAGGLRFLLSREGLLQPWMRLRTTEPDEARRLDGMPAFRVLNRRADPKPGAMTVAEVSDRAGQHFPALAVQRYGNGRSAAVLIGDTWRWGMRSPEAHADFDKTWRQLIRWALAGVPQRAAIDVAPDPEAPDRRKLVRVRVLEKDFQPARNARVQLRVQAPGGAWSDADAQPDPSEPGLFSAKVSGADPGAWIAEALATDRSDGFTVRVSTGWASNPAGDEFRNLEPRSAELAALAASTNGSMPDPDRLDAWVAGLNKRPLPVMETQTVPLWHHAGWLALAIGCFAGEWGLRRWKGLP